MPTDGVVLGTRQIYILPTRHGLLFALGVGGAGAGRGQLQQRPRLPAHLSARQHGSRVAAACAAQPAQAARYRGRWRSGICRRAGAVSDLLDNDSGARYALRVETARDVLPPFDIPAHDTRCVALSVPTVKRGWLDCPPLTLASVYPLGITRAWSRRLSLPTRCLVYPKPADEAPWQTAAGVEGESRPGAATKDGEDFTGLRAYQPGDAPARISWKTLARGQGLYTKDFRAPLAESVWLDWDALMPHDAETRLGLLCRAVLDAEDSGLAYGLRLPGVVLEPDSVRHIVTIASRPWPCNESHT